MGRGSSKVGGGGGGGKPSDGVPMSEQIDMMEHYVSGEGFSMNDYVRGLDVDDAEYSESEIADFADRFTKVMDAQSLPKADQVYRGASFDTLTQNTGLTPKQISADPSILIGKTITEPGFMSTTHDYSMATEYANGRVVWQIDLPKGAKAVHQNSILKYLDGDEITVQRNSRVKIDNAYNADGVTFIQAHYVGTKK